MSTVSGMSAMPASLRSLYSHHRNTRRELPLAETSPPVHIALESTIHITGKGTKARFVFA
jgi:hypothetical protein